jgi:hypothetical protein
MMNIDLNAIVSIIAACAVLAPGGVRAENEIFTLRMGNGLGRDISQYELKFNDFRSAGVLPRGTSIVYDCIDLEWPRKLTIEWKDHKGVTRVSQFDIAQLEPTTANQRRWLIVSFSDDGLRAFGANVPLLSDGTGKCMAAPKARD